MTLDSRRSSLLLGALGIACLLAGLVLYLRQPPAPSSHAAKPTATPAGPPVDLSAKLPFDASIATATLKNGLTYFVRANRQPEHRAELRLVVNAGSVLEDDDQRGLAHFVEHMAFNGTTHFPKHQVGEFLESVGMRFGPGVNAATGYDDTVYRIQIPTDQPGVLEKALSILEDWAHEVTFDAAEIEKERPVILEEWRARLGAGARLQEELFPVMVKGSRYADRLPIGTPESIRTFKPARLKQFYADWYRPDLMAVVAVGDFDQSKVAALVERRFATVPARPNPRPRPAVIVPPQPGTAFVVAADREATATTVSMAHKRAPGEAATTGDYRRDTIGQLMAGMMSVRLSEVAQRPNGPLVSAAVSTAPPVRALAMTTLAASVKIGAAEEGLRVLAMERARLLKFGFTEPELERQKETALRGFERAIAEKDRQPSASLAAEYIRHVTTGEAVPGLQWEFDTTTRLLPGISLDEVNAALKTWLPEDNRVVSVGVPERAGSARPSEARLAQAMAAAANASLTPWVVRATADAILDREPTPGSIVQTTAKPEIGLTEWTLSNGARVVLLPTTFQEDQIVFSAVAEGGLSLASDADLVPAQTAAQAVTTMGFGRFSSGDLRRWLTGKGVNVQPGIGPFEQGLSGVSSRRDLETLFQLVYAMMTAPRRDAVIFDSLRSQMRDALTSQAASPDYAMAQAMSETMTQGHPRAKPITADSIVRMDMNKSLAFYKARFGDASAFTFVFAGNFDLETMRPLVTRYLASLPATHAGERWRDPGIRPPRGVVTRVVERGLEPRSRTVLLFTGPIAADREHAVAVVALADVLQLQLAESLREELGGTYSVNVGGNVTRVPVGQYTVSVDFTSDPARADALTTRVFAEIAKIKQAGPTPQEMTDARAALLRNFETNVRQNAFLVGQLAQRYQAGEPPESVWQMPAVYKALTPAMIRDLARTCLDEKNYAKIVLKPQAK